MIVLLIMAACSNLGQPIKDQTSQTGQPDESQANQPGQSPNQNESGQSQVKSTETEISQSHADPSANVINQGIKLLPNQFTLTTKIGTKVGQMQLTFLKQFTSKEPLSEENFAAAFTGKVTLTADYEYWDEDAAFLPNNYCFENFDQASLDKLPIFIKTSTEDIRFCTDQNAYLIKNLGKKSGRATFEITSFNFNYYPIEITNYADIDKIISVSKASAPN